MKKISILFLLVLLPLIASAYMVKIDDIYYDLNVNDYTATVTSNDNILGGSYNGTVIIPEKLNYWVSNKNHVFYVRSIGSNAFYNCSVSSVKIPYTVTSIDGGAFRGCSNLTSVNIPYGVTSIGREAFYGCSLISIEIPSSVTSIGDNAFDGCNLRSVIVSAGNTKYDSRDDCNAIIETATNTLIVGSYNTVIPNSVTSIGSSAFSGCSYLTSIEIPNSVTSIGSNAFSGCSGLKSVSIGNSVTSIGSYAFYDCSDLKSVSIGNSVTSIGYYAFKNCSGLTSVEIPNSVTSIGDGAFGSCSGLTQVTLNSNDIVSKSYSSTSTLSSFFGKQVKAYILGNSVTSIGEYAFYCSGLTSVTIPQSVTSIGNYAFYGCSGLTSVTIPQSVTSIGSNAFKSCSGLTSVTIPNSVTKIGRGVFSDCSGLTSVTIPNSVISIGDWAFYGCSGLKSVSIGNSVTSIGFYAFQGCTGLTSVTIPNSVTSIGSEAFENCSGLKNVYCYAENVPSVGSDVFISSNITNATLYVPYSSVDTYKTSTPWSGFGNILALPEPLNYYDYGLTMKTLIYKTEWADVLNSAPNAVAVAEAELEEWAASQTNVIVKKNNAYYCPNFILTDLTEIAGSGYEKTGFYSPYDFTVKKGSYRRQAYAGYNTICVPFSFTASDLSGTAKTYAFEHYDDGEGKAIFKRVTGTIAAGTPCIVKESGNVVWNINLANKEISASSSSEDSHMRGTFVSTDVYQGKGYSPNSVNEFSPLSQYLHPFRACLILGSVSGARAIRLVLDDAVTDIDEVEVDSATLKNGKYLEKGKLVIYKSGRKYNANGSTIK